jgi:glycosyltransferase involved in cell wall biosynthesis
MSQKIDVSIISSGANIADARLHRLTNALLRAGLTVELFAPGNPADAPRVMNDHLAGAPTPTELNQGAEGIATGSLILRSCTSPWTRGKGLIPRYVRSRTFVSRARGKVIYAISPEAFAPAFAWSRFCTHVLFRKRFFTADLYEDYLRLLQDRAWAKKYAGVLGAIARSDTKWALRFAARAELTTVADVQVPPFNSRNRLVVRNLPDASILTQSGERSKTPRAIYIGDLRKSRGLYTMLEVAEKLPHWQFDFVGSIAPTDQEYVSAWLARNSATNASGGQSANSRVKFHGKLAPRDSWKFAEGAWVGLSLLESTPAFVEAVPSKLYEYMSVGLASVSTPLPRCIELINQSGAGVVAASADEIVAQLKHWEENPAELDQVRATAKKWADSHLDSKTEYETFAASISALLR